MRTTLQEWPGAHRPDLGSLRPSVVTDQCLVLQYWRVASLCHDPLQLAVRPHNFEAHIQYLSEHFDVLSVDELAAHLITRQPFRKASVVLTFDGGYAELLYTVQDVLRQFGVCATAFVPSAGMIGREPMWYDELEDLFVANETSSELDLFVNGTPLRWPVRTRRERFAAYKQLFALLAPRSHADQVDILVQLRQQLQYSGQEFDCHRTLDAQEVSRLDRENIIAIGGHTHHGVSLASMPGDADVAEIAKNRETLEEVLGHPIRHFAYPSWCTDRPKPSHIETVRQQGFGLAFCNSPAAVGARAGQDLFQVPRVRVGDRNLYAFHQLLSQFLS
jgi:peptidoglycan/xylan/chitin deacetylase (PgdA/CDA1 family)